MSGFLWECVKAFALCSAGVALFSILLRSPKSSLIPAAALGGAGYLIYKIALMSGSPELAANFFGAALISCGAEWLARRRKMPVTIFLFPGILPLVPGYGLYITMLNLINGDVEQFIMTGAQTFFIAGVIIVPMLLAGTAARRIAALARKRNRTRQEGIS